MRLRDTAKQKHIHRWKITKREEKSDGSYNWHTYEMEPSHPLTLHRECEDCMAKQKGFVHDPSVLVKGYENVADIEWQNK